MRITHLNRSESYEGTRKTIGPRHLKILEVLDNQSLTPWEISDITGWPVYQIRPRLTELDTLGVIEVTGKKFQEKTNRNESLYSKSKNLIQLEFI